ncbi:hypothetical protein JHN63_03765 [Streptomyces sp. MBT65]|uniref:hypothetical protein n=1 Tax=Streptomyces sp. MBT65 TaxID=1488395 RepID=UPI00190B2951|nr:hypothetical protein [Streptomyces sp. MBT65]MBK3572954.1 hypothetical protein [Streptomyces sp. MBT65]
MTCLGTARQSYGPAVTSADIAVDHTTDVSCLVAPPLASTTVDITWSNGLHSTAAVTVVVTPRTTGTTVSGL